MSNEQALRAADDVAEMIRLRESRTPSLNQLRAWEAALREAALTAHARPVDEAVARDLRMVAQHVEICGPDPTIREAINRLQDALQPAQATPAAVDAWKYDARYWQEGQAGNANVVSFDGEDVRPICRIEDSTLKAIVIAQHNKAMTAALAAPHAQDTAPEGFGDPHWGPSYPQPWAAQDTAPDCTCVNSGVLVRELHSKSCAIQQDTAPRGGGEFVAEDIMFGWRLAQSKVAKQDAEQIAYGIARKRTAPPAAQASDTGKRCAQCGFPVSRNPVNCPAACHKQASDTIRITPRAMLDTDPVPDDFRNAASGYRAGWNDRHRYDAQASDTGRGEAVAWHALFDLAQDVHQVAPELGDRLTEQLRQIRTHKPMQASEGADSAWKVLGGRPSPAALHDAFYERCVLELTPRELSVMEEIEQRAHERDAARATQEPTP